MRFLFKMTNETQNINEEQKKDFFNYLKDNEIKFNYSRVF